MGHFIWGKSYDFKIRGQEASSFLVVLSGMHFSLWSVEAGLTRPKSAGNYIGISAIDKSIKRIAVYKFLFRKISGGAK